MYFLEDFKRKVNSKPKDSTEKEGNLIPFAQTNTVIWEAEVKEYAKRTTIYKISKICTFVTI